MLVDEKDGLILSLDGYDLMVTRWGQLTPIAGGVDPSAIAP